MLQTMLDDLDLGIKLWRHVAKGQKYMLDKHHFRVFFTFFTFLFDVPELKRDGMIMVNE